MGQDQDDLVFIPITTAQRKVFGTDFPGTVSMIAVKAQNDQVISMTQEDITEILQHRHHIGKIKMTISKFEIWLKCKKLSNPQPKRCRFF